MITKIIENLFSHINNQAIENEVKIVHFPLENEEK